MLSVCWTTPDHGQKFNVLFEAIQRVDKELSRREESARKPTQAELSRHALEQKRSRRTPRYPDAGRTASEGMRPNARRKAVKVGTTKKEIGRVSQANKVAQARKDAR